ncbi:TonB-dependent receptor plug domain-containing protein [Aliikangiella sp. IMCC44359]|uniref:TonB-dependent receptor plug domain-containing protein n=1 Tax=Aliikangiella sp. IMCC44359 TaxID=3459125 RepID=UPI00403ACD91
MNKKILCYLSTLTLSLPLTLWAEQENSVQTQKASEDNGDVIVVTGSRRTGKSITETTSPIDVISNEEISSFASDDIKDVLQALSPSFNVALYPSQDGSTFVRPPTLRGLPGGKVLVLVNGKRIHRSALVTLSGSDGVRGSQAVDMGQLPAASIERIEVLRDGAAAQYGSDAIAGVINVILKDKAGGNFSVRHRQYYEGETSESISTNYGFNIGETGFLNLSLQYNDSEETSRGVQRPDAARGAQAGLPIDSLVQTWGSPNRESTRFVYNGNFEIGEKTEFYYFGNASKTEQDGGFFWRRPPNVPNEDFTDVLSPASPYRRSAIQDLSDADLQVIANEWGTTVEALRNWDLSTIFPGGFTPRFFGEVSDLSFFSGMRGELENGLNWDVSISTGENEIDYELMNTVNPSLGPLTPFRFKPGSLRQQESKFNADFSYPWETNAFASPINVAFGFEYKEEEYEIGLGDLASYQVGPFNDRPVGSNGFPGFGPNAVGKFNRDNTALYLDLETDITNDFILGFAVRFENYSDFGSTSDAKVSSRYQVNETFAVRGAVSTGFRAPTLGQQFTTNTATNAGTGVPVVEGLFPSTNPISLALGGKQLAPEESENISLGLVIEPNNNLTMTLDYYRIDISDRLALTSTFDVTDDLRALLTPEEQTSVSNIDGVRFFANAFDSITSGIEAVTSYNLGLDNGDDMKFILSLSHNKTEIDQDSILLVPPSGDPTSPNLNPILALNDIQNIENGPPQNRGSFTVNYKTGALTLTARARYFGEWIVGSNTPGNETWYGTKTFFDLGMNYQLSEDYSIAFGLQNAGDQYPSKLPNAASAEVGQSAGDCCGRLYSSSAPYNYNGGSYYLNFKANFK